MKQQIEDILDELYENVEDGEYWDKTMHDLTALMCYREVRAYMLIPWEDLQTLPSYSRIEKYLLERYPIEVIQKAIEQVKNELK